MMSPDVLVLNRKPTSGCNMPRVAHFKTKTKEPRCFTSIEAEECFTLEPCMHTHTQQASQCKWRGLLEMKDSLTSPLVRDHCPPFCYSVLWSCGKQMTSEPQHCVQVGKKRKGEGRQCCGRASILAVPSSNAIPTVPSLRAARGCFSGLQTLLQLARAAAKLESDLREQGVLLQQHKGFSHLAGSSSFMVEGVLQTSCFWFVPLHTGTKESCFACEKGRQESNNRESNKN